jgi:NAD(P)H-dependent flavin oxidoreductase YrpB (nitropropane dioxygenase family)
MTSLLGTPLPLAAAPMAGGPTTPRLVDAVVGAGGFAFLAAGYLSADAMATDIRAARRHDASFGVNLFVPQPGPVNTEAFRRYAARLRPEGAAFGLEMSSEPVADDDQWREKLDVLLDDPVPVVSLTFGLPDPADIRALRARGTVVLASVTTPTEARHAEEIGVDGLMVQGPRAGGHSATFDPDRAIGDDPTSDVVRAVRSTVGLPVIAGGGVDGPAAVQELLGAGADAVAVGTLLLRSSESGTSNPHRSALADPRFRRTVITKAFTGRPARALDNEFIERHDHAAISAYPAVHHLTRPMRRAAAETGDPHRLHLWAGTGYQQAEPRPAAEIVRGLVQQL